MIKKLSIFNLIFIAVLLLAAVLPPFGAFAEDVPITSFDEHTIYEDLQGAIILGKEFNIEDYPVSSTGAVQLLAFTEYSFSLKHEYQKSYGLYLYVYVPQGGIVDSEKNEVTIADAYNSYGEPSHWSDYKLQLLSKDATDVLYKFKVLDADKEFTVTRIYNRVAMSSSERRYDINGIELHFLENANATNFGIGGTWTITGFDKGMHDSSMEQSTLQSVATFQNTLKLDVHSTYYRTWKNIVNTVGDQLSSVYFSVDNAIDKEYDRLYAIDFDTYKYLSSPIFCIYDKWYPGISNLFVDCDGVYKNLYNQRTKAISEFENLPNADYTWLRWCNMDDASFAFYGNSSPYPPNDMYVYLDCLAWVLQTSNENDHKFTSEELLAYMTNFSNEFGGSVRGKYNSLLFSDRFYAPLYAELSDKVFTGANIGRTITYDDSWPIDGSLTQYDFGDVLKLIFEHTQDTADIDLKPIQEVTWSEIQYLTDEQISQRFFVAESDVPEFKYYVKNENAKNKSVYLFRYDMESFYNDKLYAENRGICGYVWQEPIYLDFDIISLTYEKAGVQTVLPVVSDPIDIIAGVEPPANTLIDIDGAISSVLVSVFTLILSIVAIVVFVWIFIRGLKYVFTGK